MRQCRHLQAINNEQMKLLADWLIDCGGFHYDVNNGELRRRKKRNKSKKARKNAAQKQVFSIIDAVIQHNDIVKDGMNEDDTLQSQSQSLIRLDTLMADILHVMFHGFATTLNTVQFALLLLAKHDSIQQRMYDELERVVIVEHSQVAFTLDLVLECHILRAFVAEVMRCCHILP
eukprot:CAMPEP_0202734062 /NCGR_PEP_ID=MMETSP1385-20130828/188488_1 /ASSEMBLY_ACC=CAM_ASM_000861 /TAXON_ID=933848 /ORGANISM="Elphidium margaritaceum" /LENGTH=174 /DNA_ID=CAMNT_0049400407 /DNA_START=480 /DNA_END=1000 /DNA_ORIENTATION=+